MGQCNSGRCCSEERREGGDSPGNCEPAVMFSDEAVAHSAHSDDGTNLGASEVGAADGEATAELGPQDAASGPSAGEMGRQSSSGEFGRQTSSDIKLAIDRRVNRQLKKVTDQDGFFVDLGINSEKEMRKALESYGIETSQLTTRVACSKQMETYRKRIITNENFDGEHVLGAVLAERAMEATLDDRPIAEYLWQKKCVVAFVQINCPLMKLKQGVMLLKERPELDAVLDKVVALSYFGVKVKSTIRQADRAGIDAAVSQQLEWGRRICAKGLVPIVEIQVSLAVSKRAQCEQMLFNALLDGLGGLRQMEKFMFELTIPVQPNTYMPLLGHPNLIRMMASSPGTCDRAESCAMLAHNAGIVACFRAGFVEGFTQQQPEDVFDQALKESSNALYRASVVMPTKQLQTTKVANTDGFFVALQSTPEHALKNYSLDPSLYPTLKEKLGVVHVMRTRIFTHPHFNGARVLATVLREDTMLLEVEGMPTARYLWEQKNIVPFLKLDHPVTEERDGVQLLGKLSNLDQLLEKASAAGMFGAVCQSYARLANTQGIKALVDQLFKTARRIMSKGLVAVLRPEVSIESPDKEDVERLLLDALIVSLDELRSDEKVIFWLTPPDRRNMYLPIIGHPNTIRVVALSGGYGRSTACEKVRENVGMIAGFNCAFVEGLTLDSPDDAFTKTLDASCDYLFKVSRRLPPKEEQVSKVQHQDGFFAAFDQDGGHRHKVLASYGIEQQSFATDEEEAISILHEMHTRIITHPNFNGSRVIGVFYTYASMERPVLGIPLPVYLWERKHIVSFLKIDKGLKPERNGVQLPKDIPDLEDLLDRSLELGVFGAKLKTMIKRADAAGIRRAVEKHFELGRRVLAKGLIPILHLEVDISSPEKAACERILRQEVQAALRGLRAQEKIILEFSLPEKPDMFAALVRSSSVLRLVFSSGGFSKKDALQRLTLNQGIGGFGRAFFEEMRTQQTDKEFSKTLRDACQGTYEASRSCQGTDEGLTVQRPPSRRNSNVGDAELERFQCV